MVIDKQTDQSNKLLKSQRFGLNNRINEITNDLVQCQNKFLRNDNVEGRTDALRRTGIKKDGH